MAKHGKTWQNMANHSKHGKAWQNMANMAKHGKTWQSMEKHFFFFNFWLDQNLPTDIFFYIRQDMECPAPAPHQPQARRSPAPTSHGHSLSAGLRSKVGGLVTTKVSTYARIIVLAWQAGLCICEALLWERYRASE